ncbi:hypothetical protein EDD85DRAFT_952571 [Armillaria nabsnona]|nr:hypothetical protein EDD85DRAFT_952571 [Armillaria nabsnona]
MPEKREITPVDDSSNKRPKSGDSSNVLPPQLQDLLAKKGSPSDILLAIIALLLQQDDAYQASRENREAILAALNAKFTDPNKPPNSSSFSAATKKLLKDRLGVKIDRKDWTESGLTNTIERSQYFGDDIEPLYNQLEIVHNRFSKSQNEASARVVINTFLTFVTAAILKRRETSTKAAIKAKLGAKPTITAITDLLPPINPSSEIDTVVSMFLKTPAGAGFPSTLAEFNADHAAAFIWWGNQYMSNGRLVDLDESYDARIFPEFGIGPDVGVSQGATLIDVDGQPFKLSGVSDYAVLVFKSRDEDRIVPFTRKHVMEHLSETEEHRVFPVESKQLNPVGLDSGPLSEASAQALALSALTSERTVRFLITDSKEWLLAHLDNDDSAAPDRISRQVLVMPSIDDLKVYEPFSEQYGSLLVREEAIERWQIRVRRVYTLLMGWLLPDTQSIKSPHLDYPKSPSPAKT